MQFKRGIKNAPANCVFSQSQINSTSLFIPSHDNPFDVPDNISLQTLQNVGFPWEHEYIYQLWAPDNLSKRSDCCKNQ